MNKNRLNKYMGAALAWLWLVGGVHAQDATLGRNLAAGCAACHGTNGAARGDAVKPLAGVAADKIVAAFNEFRSGARPATVMHQIAKGYSDAQVRAMADHFAAQPARP
jgi:cytochrome subunit of sulfide dehydrogenase